MKTMMGNYHLLVQSTVEKCRYPLSYLAESQTDIITWQTQGRAKVLESLAYSPEPTPLNATVDRKFVKDGLIVEHISYDQPFGPRTEGILLYPANSKEKLPAVVALHDHGGFKYYGKEKLVDMDNESEIMVAFKERYYEGRGWATELAKRGYVVFVPDVFLWGSRKMEPEAITEQYVEHVLAEVKGTDTYIEAYNKFASDHETFIAKTLYLSGTTWTGIMAYEDRRAVDYLLTRPEVDPERLGCGGLSGGGLRTIFLSATDSRVKCSVCVGFMSTNDEVVAKRISYHTWMLHVPQLSSLLDMPDILSLHGNNPVMVQYDIDDPLWTIEGQRASDEKLQKIYGKMGASNKYSGKFYPGLHKFDAEMQDDAFDWFDQWL